MGHYCRICRRQQPNEEFSGKGHKIHVCKRCKAMPKSERQVIENMDDIFRFMRQSHISEKNVARLEQMVKSENSQVASLAAIVSRCSILCAESERQHSRGQYGWVRRRAGRATSRRLWIHRNEKSNAAGGFFARSRGLLPADGSRHFDAQSTSRARSPNVFVRVKHPDGLAGWNAKDAFPSRYIRGTLGIDWVDILDCVVFWIGDFHLATFQTASA
jgi:hypothetical protein